MAWSTVLIIPAALLEKANLLGAALGYGPDSYTVPIPSEEEATHYGAHTLASAEFFELILAAQPGSLPPIDWSAAGLTEGDVLAVLAALVVSAPGSPLDPEGMPHASPGEHFAAAVAGLEG